MHEEEHTLALRDRIADQLGCNDGLAAAGRPTGSGKTVIAAELIRDAVAQGKRVLFLVHRRELVSQSARKLYDAGIDPGIILAGGPEMRLAQPVQVASIPTL